MQQIKSLNEIISKSNTVCFVGLLFNSWYKLYTLALFYFNFIFSSLVFKCLCAVRSLRWWCAAELSVKQPINEIAPECPRPVFRKEQNSPPKEIALYWKIVITFLLLNIIEFVTIKPIVLITWQKLQ